jgi:RNA polymerase sigma-70 factor (ECF subfamily)
VLTEDAFPAIVELHRAELHRHCAHLLGSSAEADDALQDTFLRAWRARDGFGHRSSVRTWLFRIATNACFDVRARRAAAPTAHEPPEPAAPREHEPDAVLIAKETLELTLRTAVRHLSAHQQASLVLRDVLDWSARDTARALAISVPAANSALQRARGGVRERLAGPRLEWAA